MVQIHPKRAFLNSDIIINNKGEESVIVEDSITHESFSLSSKEFISLRFPAGEHKVVIKQQNGSCYEDTFVVEDALKFGGSERKKCYIFDDNSWIILVMKDRTYFYNEETKEQFVEHNFSPDKIEELNSNYLLFTTGGNCSVYSLITMSIEKTLSSSKCVYNGKNHCVMDDGKELLIYYLASNTLQDKCCSYRYDSYIIDETEGIISLFNRNDSTKVIRIMLFDEDVSGEHMKLSSASYDGSFVCFISCNSFLYTNRISEVTSPTEIYYKSLSSARPHVLIYKSEEPIIEINGIRIWDFCTYSDINNKYKNKTIESGEGRELTIEVCESNNHIYQIVTEKIITVYKTLKQLNNPDTGVKAKQTISSILYEDNNIIFKNEERQLSFSSRGNYVYVSCGNNTYVIIDDICYTVYGELLFTNQDDPYVNVGTTEKPRFTLLSGTTIKCVVDKSYPTFGFFYNHNQSGDSLFWLKTNKWYVGQEVSMYQGDYVVSGGQKAIPPRFFICGEGLVLPIPGSTVDIIARSKSGKNVLLEKGGFFCYARFKEKEWQFSDDIVLSIYDKLKVKDAVFCSDGNSFIYQKDDGLVLYDFATGKETIFSSNDGIKYNVNGYRPYYNRDYYSRPVIIDPLSHRIVDNNCLRQYRFSNVEGTAYCESRIVKRLMRTNDVEVPDIKYLALRKEYDYFQTTDVSERIRIRQKRLLYWKKTGGVNLSSTSYLLQVDNFVDLYVVHNIEFVIIRINGTRKEIRLGAPLYFLNYVSFSPDSTKVAICGKYRDASGLCMIYDLINDKEVHRSTLQEKNGVGMTKAIWLGLFSKKGDVAYYDSVPNTFFIRDGVAPIRILGRSFLTFSPSGNYMALSKQGYTPYSSEDEFWGHRPSCDIYIANTNNPTTCLCHFNDHGAGIVGVGIMRETIASASFSIDDKKILSVSKDGVVVVRNLHLDDTK